MNIFGYKYLWAVATNNKILIDVFYNTRMVTKYNYATVGYMKDLIVLIRICNNRVFALVNYGIAANQLVFGHSYLIWLTVHTSQHVGKYHLLPVGVANPFVHPCVAQSSCAIPICLMCSRTF